MDSKSMEKKTALRQLMKQAKQKRIDSPFAKYSNTGELRCSLCDQQITSETFWNAHVNGREHKQKAIELKSQIKQGAAQPAAVPSPEKTPRGVKRSHDTAVASDSPSSALPADFFDSTPSKAPVVEKTPVTSSAESSSALPEGFFDNPEKDARARKVEYVNKMEVEWDAFTREMKQETTVSEKIEATDDQDRDIERDLKETSELISRWQKIEEMHDLKEQIVKTKKKSTSEAKTNGTTNDDDEIDDENLEKELESMYNWRQKRS